LRYNHCHLSVLILVQLTLQNFTRNSLPTSQTIQIKCEEVERERSSLTIQKLRLLRFVSEFKNNNSMFMKLGQFIEERSI
jgi:hypothetical protein